MQLDLRENVTMYVYWPLSPLLECIQAGKCDNVCMLTKYVFFSWKINVYLLREFGELLELP